MADVDTTLTATVAAAADTLDEWNGPDGSLVIQSVARNLRRALEEATPAATDDQLRKAERRGARAVLSRLDEDVAQAQHLLRHLAVGRALVGDTVGVARVEGKREAHQLTRGRIAGLLDQETP